MNIKTDTLLEVLEIGIEAGCSHHQVCEKCKNLTACMDSWAGIHGIFFTSSMTKEQLKDYIDGFNQFLEARCQICQGSGPH